MPDHPADTPAEKITEAAQQAATLEKSPAAVQWYRTAVFRIALLLAIIVFALLTFLVETTPSFPIDLQITRAIQSIQLPFFEGFMRVISWPGFLPQSVFVVLLIAFLFYRNDLRWEAFVAPLASLCSGVVNQLIKSLIQRPRPTGDLVDVFEVLNSYSFPSGHVMQYTILFGFVWYVAYVLLKRSWQRSFLLMLFGSFIALVGISRIYLGQHWASDVLGAYVLGGLVLTGIIAFHQWGKQRYFTDQRITSSDPKNER